MKRLLVALFLIATALILVSDAKAASGGYHYLWRDVTWGSDSVSFYIPDGASIAIKNSDIITLPSNTYWVTSGTTDSMPQFIVSGAISAAGASTDTLLLGAQFTFDGTNYVPALDWDTDDQCHVGAGLYFTYRGVALMSSTLIADAAAGANRYAAAVPNTVGFFTIPKGCLGMRLVIHPSNAARTLNGKLRCKVGIPICND